MKRIVAACAIWLLPALAIAADTPLLKATEAGDLGAVNALLAKGARASEASDIGVTPAYIAATNGNAAVLRRLLDAGANVATTDGSGDTLLMAAVRAGNVDAVELLLDRGAAVNAADPQFGHTAMMWAVRRNDTAITQLLLKHGAAIEAHTRVGEKPAVRPPGAGGGSHGVGIVRSGVPTQGEQQPTPGGMTPLLFAARDGRLDAAKLLVEGGADVNAADPNGITPMVMALTNGQIAVGKFLLEHGADPKRADWWSRTPLWAAVDSRNLAARSGTSQYENGVDRAAALDIITALLDRDVDVNARVKEFPPARRYLLPLGSLEWVNFTGQTAFIRAAQSADVPVMKLLLAKGADPKITTVNGTNALMAAAGVNWVIGETFSESPATWIQAVQLCLDQGLDVDATNEMGLQAVHGAANRGSDGIIELLAKHGAQLDHPDKEGRTPYVWAQGVFLATNSPVAKPSTMALLDRLANGAAAAAVKKTAEAR
jgi:ankyrin repeat protein